jgi:hypothetical protein
MCFQVNDVLSSMHKDASEPGEVKSAEGVFNAELMVVLPLTISSCRSGKGGKRIFCFPFFSQQQLYDFRHLSSRMPIQILFICE